ncbi:alpha-amylase [Marinicrinis sediminis]|uniref:Alpha-amylase n=1 Tax=Marinicrinis sediminis TaxID=1652465 RepID=A0ABW5R8A0_9BACL
MKLLNRETEHLDRIYQYLKERQSTQQQDLWIPALWNTTDYTEVLEERGREIRVEAHSYLLHVIDHLLETASTEDHEAFSLEQSVMYTSLIRYSTAWDVNHDGEIESGTFLRFMVLLPMLKQMGVNVLYLLPVSKYSEINMKGDIGSPYAVQNMFELDPQLHDPLLDHMENGSLHDELRALVEGCHLLNIKVVHDFIPRVTAKDAAFLAEHPDWVYWIRLEELEGFKPPHIPELSFFEECTPDKLETVYRSEETHTFLQKFSPSPDQLNPVLWEQVKRISQQTGANLLRLVEEHMGITTSPAHSDWINDVQPIWTDITFYRLYKDTCPQVLPYVSENKPPYVLFDTIKCNLYPGEEPNQELWDYLEQAVRFYMSSYGLDGFRVDIGHTLPVPLLDHLFKVIRELNPHAILISEDLFNRNHRQAAASGYNMMLGSGWQVMSELTKPVLTHYVEELKELSLQAFACAETPDTPRITSRPGGVQLARAITVFNHFLPHGTPFITTGLEVNEKQPLNCGLADNTNGADIPRAFFNKMKIDWEHDGSMMDLLKQLQACKRRYQTKFRTQDCQVWGQTPDDVVIYTYEREGLTMLVGINLNMEEARLVDLADEGQPVFPYLKLVDSMESVQSGRDLEIVSGRMRWKPGQAVVLVSDPNKMEKEREGDEKRIDPVA